MDKLKDEFGLSVKWIAFPLHPETPPEGQTLEQLFAGQGKDIGEMVARLKNIAGELGLPFGDRSMTFNSRKAQELGKWAEKQGRGEEFHLAAFKAYFAEGRNIHETKVLAGLLEQAALSPDQGIKALDSGLYAQEVDADWAYSRRCGISAVPTFQIAGMQMAGAQSYPLMADMVRDALSGKRPGMVPLM